MPSRSGSSRREFKWYTRALPALLTIGLVGAAIFRPIALASPPFNALQAVFRRFIYPLVTGEVSAQPFPHAFETYFIVVIVVVATLVVVSHRRLMRSLPPGTYIGRAAKVFGLMVLAMYLLNWQLQGGLGIPLALAYAILLLLLWWEAQRLEWTRRIVEAVVWIGMGLLVSSGSVIPLVQGDARFDLQRFHGIYGYLWLSALGAYLIEHITHYEAKRETSSRNWGYVAATVLSAAVLTGVARLHGGGTTWASGLWPHVLTGVAAAGAMAVHIGQSWKKRGLTTQPGPGRRAATFILGCLCIGFALPVVPLALAGGWRAPRAADDTALLATPEVGITASGPGHSALPVQLLSVRESATSCGRNGGCHVDIQAQWERSAHRFSANAAYRQTVRLLIQDLGIEGARQCAACHDPMALLSGQIVAGARYPNDTSEGVTCVICHSMQPGREAKNGHYEVAPSTVFTGSVRDAITAYMMIELYRNEHDTDFLAQSLTSNSMCANCHNLTHGDLVLRRTFDEWHEGPVGPGQTDTQLCTGCHMPPVGRSYLGFDLHDHRVPASNVALAALRGESPEKDAAFIAAALELQLSIARQESGAFALHARLANEKGGHTFPTAPRDLLDYWFEVQFDGRGGTSEWRRMDSAGLFPEQLIADDGRVLTRHEIWRAVRREGPEGIPARAAHEYVFPLPEPAPEVQRVTVRLMHRRYRDTFVGFLESDNGGLYTDALEILRRTIEWTPS